MQQLYQCAKYVLFVSLVRAALARRLSRSVLCVCARVTAAAGAYVLDP